MRDEHHESTRHSPRRNQPLARGFPIVELSGWMRGMRSNRVGEVHVCSRFVDPSPNRFVDTLTVVEAGEPSAESFDRFPPRQLDLQSSPGAKQTNGSAPHLLT